MAAMDAPQPKPKASPKVTRGKILARAEEVAKDVVGEGTPLDTAFAAFSQFDGPEGEKDPQAIARAQAEVCRLLKLA